MINRKEIPGNRDFFWSNDYVTFEPPDHILNTSKLGERLFPAANKCTCVYTGYGLATKCCRVFSFKSQTMKKAELQEKLIEAYQLEDILRIEAKEAFAKLREARKRRVALEKLLNSDSN